ncbi:hypothetical protein GXW82_23560 [Streptacidiphilus sp. 4-A2]|nr:hypothetical protein [Streptacidiphilus sp. 4-A2]
MTGTTIASGSADRRGRREAPVEIRGNVMADELARGRARYLSATIKDFVRYRDAWWILDRDLWFAVDDEDLMASLDAAAEAMAAADAGVRARRGPGRVG